LGERIDEENDLAEGKIFHQSVLKKNLPRMSELELANVLASRGFINPRAIAKRGYPAVFDAIIRSKKEHNPVNSLSSENSLNDIKQKIPLDFRFMRGEGRDIVIDMALEIIEGKRDRFPGEGDFIFVGGHLLKRKVAALAADILHAKGTDEIIALGEKIRKLNTMEKENEFESAFRIAKGEKKKSKKSEILTESQIRSLLRIAEDKINGRISRKSSRQDLYFRIGKSFETLDERVALRKTIKPSIDDE
jgi:hypothetical protein